jgi:hypothetical protein
MLLHIYVYHYLPRAISGCSPNYILLTDILYFAENVFTKSGCLPPPSWTVDDDVTTEMVTSGHQMATSHQSHFD